MKPNEKSEPLTKDKIKAEVLKLYTPPFHYSSAGYIFDSEGHTFSDSGCVVGEERMMARIRGWGRLSYMEHPHELQDAAGEMYAEALNLYWAQATKATSKNSEKPSET